MRNQNQRSAVPRIRVSSSSLCSRDDIATLLLLSSRHVGKLAERGLLKRVSGKFDLVPTVQGYIQHLRKTHGLDDGGSANDHKLRLLKAKADIADLEAKKAAGEYVSVGDVERTWVDCTIRLRQRLLAIPPRVASQLACETSADACCEVLEMIIHEALNELASGAKAAIDA